MAKERLADSIISAEERARIIREESAQIEKEMAEVEAKRKEMQAQRNVEIRKEEDVAIKKFTDISSFETRDQILDRIREMREEKPAEIVHPKIPLTPRMQAEFDAVEKLGREMVAKAEAEVERARAMRAQVEAAERLRNGTMEQVFQANPGANEPFPVNKATFGQPRK